MNSERHSMGAGVRVAVVGGGLAGLVAVLTARNAGHDVTLYERASSTGGRGRSPALGGLTMNLGGHAIYRTGQAARILEHLGVALDGGVPPLRGTVALEGALDHAPYGLMSLLRSRMLRGERMSFVRLLRRIQAEAPDANMGVSWDGWLDAVGIGDASRALGRAYARLTTYVDAPSLLPAGVVLRQFQRAMRGVLYLHGGWQRIVDDLDTAATAAGVDIRRGAPVLSVDVAEDARCVRTRESAEYFDAVVLAVPPGVCAALVPASTTMRRAADGCAPCSLATLDLALRAAPVPERYFVMGVDVPVNVVLHSAVARLGPGVAVHAHAYQPPCAQSRPDERERVEAMLDLAQPGWRAQVDQVRWLPSMVVMHDAPRVGVARLSVDVAGVPGVAVCGDWVGDDLLLDAALSSAQAAVDSAVAGRTMGQRTRAA